MHSVPRTLVDRFAQAFAGRDVGFAAKEITDYFSKFSYQVKPFDHYGIKPTRKALFIESVYALRPPQQYYALDELCRAEVRSRYDYPIKAQRDELLQELHSFIARTPIGLRFSSLSERAFREDWMSCITRLADDPASAITAARTMLETLLKTVISDRGQPPDDSGRLTSLLRQAEEAVGIRKKTNQAVHQILGGLTTVVEGLAAISNEAGDRHGLVAGQSIEDIGLAQLCVHASGTVGLAILELHLLRTFDGS